MAALTSLGVCRLTGMPAPRRHQHRHPGGLRGAHHRLHVVLGEDPLDRDRRPGDGRVIHASTACSISTRRRAVSSSAGVRTTSTAINRGCAPGQAVDDPETAPGQARVDSEHPHALPLRLSDRTAHAIPLDECLPNRCSLTRP